MHLAQKIASQLAFGDKMNIAPHNGIQGAHVRFAVGDLQHVLGVNNAFDVVNAAFVHGHASVVLGAKQFDEVFHRRVGGKGKHRRARLHRLADGFAAELHDRLNQVAVALLNNALFLPGLNESIHGLGRTLRLPACILLGERRNRLHEAEHDCHRHHQVNQEPQDQRPVHEPLAVGAREKHERQESIAENHDQHDADRHLQNLVNIPVAVGKQQVSDQQRDRGQDELREHCHREDGARTRNSQPGFNFLFKGVDVVLEIAREKLTQFLIHTVHIRDQRQ